MMDYEKEYKAMVQRARELHKDGNALTKQQMEIVCPELADSEDERTRKSIICFLQRGGYMTPEDRNKAYAWLEKHKEQNSGSDSEKPNNKWNDEDETAFGDLMWCIEQSRKSAKDENDMGNIWFAENWLKNRLKSIRPQPHWKPSEEQMKSLLQAEGHLRRYECREIARNIAELYNDLKKLM